MKAAASGALVLTIVAATSAARADDRVEDAPPEEAPTAPATPVPPVPSAPEPAPKPPPPPAPKGERWSARVRAGFLVSPGSRGQSIYAPSLAPGVAIALGRVVALGARYDFAWHREGLGGARVTRAFHALSLLASARLRVHPAADIEIGVGGGANVLHLMASGADGVALAAFEPHAVVDLGVHIRLPSSPVLLTFESSAYLRPSSFDRFHGAGAGLRF